MKFKLRSDKNRQVHLNMDAINIYVNKWVPETEFEIEIVRRRRTVSSPMRKYYWSVVLPTFAEHLGYEPDEYDMFHRQLKIVYFQVKPDKHGIYREKDIPAVFANDSELDISIKAKFQDWVKRKAAIEGVYIPDPGES